ncbi:substrate-binding domain-containing protein [Lactonifactor longoviformis]|uniref:sugar ABC transporter substrate-binding protein n=1 Tax=Lactonifactor TaxID=420345 RepID=UPI0012B124CE|nr:MULTISPECIES: substrate-binding domain-containing protein [Lactonifactor]MCB5712524.1 substrate-binding domain-containing protein [Lactonifactor longoviformis]MCB5716567.1 substrate-binding domain-containing protein [Lactonifactor longoviformis]MCQ4670371.1 substrate-binding domain-containing protein [Lactonifactor longoviformis]MSA00172.1 substrate-binding domain-containing protein [Lactonifactor sp. BIOML-A5]MSA06799.1 substrate-binding domain-containing protein [Lactonifactor sp. BIOML-A
MRKRIKKSVKKGAALILSMVLAAGMLAGCGGKDETAEKEPEKETQAPEEAKTDAENGDKVKFVFVTPLIAHQVWLGAKEGIEQAQKDFPGLEVSWVGPTGLDANEMIKCIELAIAEGADGIATFGLSESAMESCFKDCYEAGIDLYTAGGDTPNLHQYLAGGCNPDAVNWGYLGGKEVSKALEGKKIVAAEMLYQLDSELAIGVMEGYEKAFAEHEAGFEVVQQLSSDSDATVALQHAKDLFTAYPEVNAVVCCGGECAAAIAQAMKEMGKEPGSVIIFGDGMQEDCLEEINSGYVLGSLAQNYFQYGYRPAMWTYMKKMFGAQPAETFVDAGVTPINAENVDSFADHFKEGKQWFDTDYPDKDWSEATGAK